MIQMGQIPMNKVTNQREIFKNKALKYLLPCLKEYGDEFSTKLGNVCKIAIGLGDILVNETNNKIHIHEQHLFILIDSTIAPTYFNNFIEWIRTQPMYADDYVYDNIQKSTYHMVVIAFPERLYEAVDKFKKGEYSKMFTQADIKKFFSNHPKTEKILVKDKNYKFSWVKSLNKRFGSTLEPSDLGDEAELDEPPKKELEIFNVHLKKK